MQREERQSNGLKVVGTALMESGRTFPQQLVLTSFSLHYTHKKVNLLIVPGKQDRKTSYFLTPPPPNKKSRTGKVLPSWEIGIETFKA